MVFPSLNAGKQKKSDLRSFSSPACGSSKPLARTSRVKLGKSNQIAAKRRASISRIIANERCAWDLTMPTGWHFSGPVRYDRCRGGEGVGRGTRKAWSPKLNSEV